MLATCHPERNEVKSKDLSLSELEILRLRYALLKMTEVWK
jgi:hypothetical protein